MVNLSVQDIIPEGSALEQFSSGTVAPLDMIIALALGFGIGLFIFYLYKHTFTGVLYNRNFNVSLVMLTMVATLIMRTVTSNLALSLGMVGALSIVRFRTAVKDPLDTVFMFWAVGVGIALGAGSGFYIPAGIGSLAIGAFIYIMYLVRGGGNYAYLLIVRHDFESANEVAYALRKLPKGSRLKSKTVSGTGIEVTMEVRLPGENTNIVTELMRIEGVFDATLVSYQGDYAA